MKRRNFVKDSAIIGAVTLSPSFIVSGSGLYGNANYRTIHKVIKADPTYVGTLPILRAFAGDHIDYVSPFVLFDEFGPVTINPGTDPLKVEAHPHAGVTPTTYFIDGSGHHKDSLNYDFQVKKGEFMMFNSGKGAIHMEESGNELKEKGGTLHGFQIWLNTPSKHKFDAPSTVVHRPDVMPTIVYKDFKIKLVIGSLFGHSSKVETLSPAFYYHIEMNPNTTLEIPVQGNHNAFAYVLNGKVETSNQINIDKHQIALFERGKEIIRFFTKEGCDLFLLGGLPLNEPVFSYGPFVMNNEMQIRQCIHNYNTGKMGDPEIVNQ